MLFILFLDGSIQQHHCPSQGIAFKVLSGLREVNYAEWMGEKMI
jgi:hypothetical protein